jgi:hypothetical protein
VQQRQDVVVERPPHPTVEQLVLDEAPSLEQQQSARKLAGRARVDQALAGRSRYLDLLLAVQAAVRAVAEQQQTDQAALSPERHHPGGAAVCRRVDRQAQLPRGADQLDQGREHLG